MGSEHQIVHSHFVQEDYAQSSEWQDVCVIAERLISYLNMPSTLARLRLENQPKKSSAEVQNVF